MPLIAGSNDYIIYGATVPLMFQHRRVEHGDGCWIPSFAIKLLRDVLI